MNRLFFFLLALPSALFASQPDDGRLLAGIELGIAGRYSEAIFYFSKIKQEFPQHPAGHFFLAAIYQSRMMDFETNLWRDQFFAEVSQAETLARANIEREPENPYSYFYLGGALAYKSFQLGRDGDYLAAFKSAIQSKKYLEKARDLDSTFCDAYLGIGSYLYWKSKITQRFNWLPFLSDKRFAGIDYVTRAVECSKFSKWAAISNLAWIYIEEGDFEKAIHFAEIGLVRFPASRFFLWPLGDALFKKGDYQQAAEVYQSLLKSVQSESFNNGYNEVLLHFKIAECLFNLGEGEQSLCFINEGLKVRGHEAVSGKIAKVDKKLQRLKKQIEEG